jgi:hypothetical protein
MDPDKIKRLKDMPTPRTLKQLRGILGVAGYYRRFVDGFAKMAKPLYRLLKHDVPFIWTAKEHVCLKALIEALDNAPQLEYVIQSAPKQIILTHNEDSISAMLLQQ